MKDERHEFGIKIDGESYQVRDKELTAGAVLSLAAKVYADFHLVEMQAAAHKPLEYEAATEIVKLHNGMEFITKHVGPTTVS